MPYAGKGSGNSWPALGTAQPKPNQAQLKLRRAVLAILIFTAIMDCASLDMLSTALDLILIGLVLI